MNKLNIHFLAAASLLAVAAPLAADSSVENKGSYLVDPRPIAKTPKYLGVCLEAADKVVLRNIASQEITINTANIAKREKSETISLMPPGLVGSISVQDFASLLDYLEALAKEQEKK